MFLMARDSRMLGFVRAGEQSHGNHGSTPAADLVRPITLVFSLAASPPACWGRCPTTSQLPGVMFQHRAIVSSSGMDLWLSTKSNTNLSRKYLPPAEKQQ